MGHRGLKTGQKQLFEHPKRSRNKIGENDFGPFLDPQMTLPYLARARDSPLWSCDRGARMKTPVARLGDAAASRAGQAALEEHRAVATSRGGGGKAVRNTRTSGGGSGPSSFRLAMKQHGPFSSPRSRA